MVISGTLSPSGSTFFLEPSRMSLDGKSCTGSGGSTGVQGLFGPALVAAAAELSTFGSVSQLVTLDPNTAVAQVKGGSLRCGAVPLDTSGVAFVFLLLAGVPSLNIVTAGSNVLCTLPAVGGRVASTGGVGGGCCTLTRWHGCGRGGEEAGSDASPHEGSGVVCTERGEGRGVHSGPIREMRTLCGVDPSWSKFLPNAPPWPVCCSHSGPDMGPPIYHSS